MNHNNFTATLRFLQVSKIEIQQLEECCRLPNGIGDTKRERRIRAEETHWVVQNPLNLVDLRPEVWRVNL
jgi:hypothetical protein